MKTSRYDPIIPKQDLVIGEYYYGRCRNAKVARWDGEQFLYWRTKFKSMFKESIKCPEDDAVWDVFVAERVALPEEISKEILLPEVTNDTTE